MFSDTLLVAVLAFEFAFTVGLSYLTWERRHESAVAVPLFSILVLTGIWQLATICQLLSQDPSFVIFFFHLGWNAEAMVTVPWLVFALYLTGREHLVTLRRVVLLFLPYAGFAGAIATNPLHHLYFSEYGFQTVPGAGLALTVEWGPLFWLTILYGYSLIAIAILLIVEEFITSPAYRKPIAVLLGGVIVAWVGTAVHVAGLVPQERLNPAVYLMVLVVATWYIAIFHMDVLHVLPVARDKLLEVMDDGVLVADSTGRIIDANPAAVDQLGLGIDSLVGRNLPALFSEHLDDPMVLLADEPSTHELERERDEQRQHLEIRAQPVRSADIQYGDLEAGYLLLVRDITPIRERERQLERRNEQLDRFASVISHDLRNPLMVANANLDFARSEVDEDISESLTAIGNALDRIETIVDDVLTLAREGKVVEAPERLSLPVVVEDAWDAVGTREATLVTHLDDAALQADPTQFQRILENLFRNAVEHAGPEVTVEVGLVDDSTGFYIADDGPGIPEEDRERVFEPEYSSGGHGLGLEIVQTIVKAHGWTVSVTESESGGARFEIRGVEFE